ncbi:hypothetical protein DXU93_13340 [Brumimicrobium aurantiacum]|uniref:DUF1826 domain-containing protein n=1 Tax=Brumimicrobium aurantiacum TaxID=1737063 RepID=A0A3E1EV85_9FLAO|nr:hypothetical protein DXU93_13340 [Brumimicrobium aurantiacum]
MEQQIQYVKNFEDFFKTPFKGKINAIGWQRTLEGDFQEIIDKVDSSESIVELKLSVLKNLKLSKKGDLARKHLISDFIFLENNGADPIINVIKEYDRDDVFPFFPTDVYSFHVDRSPIPGATILCTYYGAASEIVANEDVQQKINIPKYREALKELHTDENQAFEIFLEENFFDLHYEMKKNVQPKKLQVGELWKLAIDHPNSPTLPSIHRAPKENKGQPRLLLIC